MATQQARVYTKANDWEDFIQVMHSGETLEVDEGIFYYFLEVLPPVWMYQIIKGQKYRFGFAEGEENIVGFWSVKSLTANGLLYFCRDTGILNRPWG